MINPYNHQTQNLEWRMFELLNIMVMQRKFGLSYEEVLLAYDGANKIMNDFKERTSAK